MPARATSLPGGIYGWTYHRVLFPAWQRLVHGRPVYRHLARLEQSQWAPRQEIERLQLADLRALLVHAGRNVPYWRELFRELRFDPRGVRSLADLTALPLLTREVVRARHDDMIDPTLRPTNVRKGTSGTTGVPLFFEYCNQSESWRLATRLRGYAWAGAPLGARTVHYWGAGAGMPGGLRGAKIRLDRALKRETYVDAARQDEASMRAFAGRLSRLRPQAVVGYTQALAAFSRWVVERGLRDWPDARVVCAAEAVLPHDRRALEAAFGPHVFDTYGSRETMLIAAECEAHRGMHLTEENLIVEVLQDGRPAAPGEEGEVVVTDLHNFGMPFIRYVNGDLAVRARDEVCPCGRTLRRLERVVGRRLDTMHDADGAPVPGLLVTSIIQHDAHMFRAFQVVQRRDGSVELRVVPARGWDEARFRATARRIEAYLKGLPLHVLPCEEIPASPAGKRRPIVVET